MITLTKKGLIECDSSLIEKLREEFTAKQCTLLPNLIEKELLEKVIQHVNNAFFYENHHTAQNDVIFASDLSMPTKNIALHELNFLLNNQQLFRLVEYITGCSEIRSFGGRIYRNMPGKDHHLDWHDDTSTAGRLIGISINLGKEKFEGGLFRIREKGSTLNLKVISCTNPGDAHLFKVSPHLEHSVTRVTGSVPRTACAGWFTDNAYSGPASMI
jgi:hypothetical protein